ncbi:MAG TPA: AraC family transcriptional regulator [Sphingomicrobium sp.]|nr:AraC family transcriptional regulator [Sphingomicrobium sp.]
MAADALSDVLKTVRMTGATFFNVAARSPWVAEQCSPEMVLPLILPGAEHMISYHIVTEGSCFACLIEGDSDPIEVHAGQVIVFTRGDAHVMSSAPGLRAQPMEPDALAGLEFPYVVSFGEDGPATVKVICGFLACDSGPFNPLLENLPPILIGESRRDDGTIPCLAPLVRFAMNEVRDRRIGSEEMLGRLTELMFVEIIRQYLEKLPAEQSGWLAGLRDPMIGKALSLMHGSPSCDWGLEELARSVGASRSEFAERFASMVGAPPMQYLAKWRMQVASGLLNDNVNIAAVAAKVGYGSEASFSRAFKKMVGVPPSVWRSQRLAA